MPVTTIYLSTTTGGSDHILSGGMISTDFLLFFFTVFGFFGYFLCFLFFLGTILLFVWFYIYFKCFWSQTSQGTREWPIPPPFLVREFSVLTKLKSYSR